MDFTVEVDNPEEIVAMFQKTFTDSEGPEAGQQIGRLVHAMLNAPARHQLIVVSAIERDFLIGAILFSPMTYPQDDRVVYILSPVAISSSHQGKGIGQALIRNGLERLLAAGTDVVLTYGDPNFYSKVGFHPISEEIAQAPQPLQYPHGWLGQSLAGGAFKPLAGPSSCVPALDDPSYW